MTRNDFTTRFAACFSQAPMLDGNYVDREHESGAENQDQTTAVFSEKWSKYDESDEQEKLYAFQRDWYLKLYGFGTEDALRTFLADKAVVFDAGCGLGYKAAWLAELAPHAVVVGMDFSEAAAHAARRYAHLENLFFLRGDIARTGFADGAIAYTSCDQVIMHTEDPEATFAELARITEPDTGEVACYFYAKKALPRELLDDYFRIRCTELSNEELWALSEQLTELGRRLSDLNVSVDVPDIPIMGIKGGEIDVQRFIYWNFLKCFWNEELGQETSVATNFDWYSPSNARRFNKEEVLALVRANGLSPVFFHQEEACHSGRFNQQ